MLSSNLERLILDPAHRHHPNGERPRFASPQQPKENGTKSLDRRLLIVLMMIGDNIQRQLVIADLAQAVNLSPGRLAHLFKSEVGVSPQRFLNNIRLQKAKEMLENGVRCIKEIAAEVGFLNVSRFCRSFKTLYGSTPGEYRKTHLRIDLKISGASTAPSSRTEL
jgi:AraC-like DNA-binding protein